MCSYEDDIETSSDMAHKHELEGRARAYEISRWTIGPESPVAGPVVRLARDSLLAGRRGYVRIKQRVGSSVSDTLSLRRRCAAWIPDIGRSQVVSYDCHVYDFAGC